MYVDQRIVMVIGEILKGMMAAQAGKVSDEMVAYIWNVWESLNRSEDELADMSTSEILALLPESAKDEIRRMAREAQHPYEVRRRVSNPGLSYSTATGMHDSVTLDNSLVVPFSYGRLEGNGQYTVRYGDSMESIADVRPGRDGQSHAQRGMRLSMHVGNFCTRKPYLGFVFGYNVFAYSKFP